MLFTAQQARLILTGHKTQHRVPRVYNEDSPLQPGHAYTARKTKELTEAELYGFTSTSVTTGRTRRRRRNVTVGFARIDILTAEQQTLGDAAYADAKAEGFRTTADFLDDWAERHDLAAVDPDQPVWAITFTVRNDDLEDQPRLLHKDSSHGYTRDRRLALADEPEAVDAKTQEWITSLRDRDHAQWLAIEEARREQTNLDLRLRDALEHADLNDVDVRRLKLRIRQDVETLEAKVRRQLAA